MGFNSSLTIILKKWLGASPIKLGSTKAEASNASIAGARDHAECWATKLTVVLWIDNSRIVFQMGGGFVKLLGKINSLFSYNLEIIKQYNVLESLA